MAFRFARLVVLSFVFVVAARATDIPIDGQRMRLDDSGHPRGQRNNMTLRDADVSLDGADPTDGGATITIGRIGGPVVVLDLPESGWSAAGMPTRPDYKFKSRTGPV